MVGASGPPRMRAGVRLSSSSSRSAAEIEMAEISPVVFVVDDDPSVRKALDNLIRSVGFRVQAFASAHDFLHSKLPDAPGCLVLDVRLDRKSTRLNSSHANISYAV